MLVSVPKGCLPCRWHGVLHMTLLNLKIKRKPQVTWWFYWCLTIGLNKDSDFGTSPFTKPQVWSSIFSNSSLNPLKVGSPESLKELEGGAERRQVLAGPHPPLHVGWHGHAAASCLPEHGPQHHVGHRELAPHEPGAPPQS